MCSCSWWAWYRLQDFTYGSEFADRDEKQVDGFVNGSIFLLPVSFFLLPSSFMRDRTKMCSVLGIGLDIPMGKVSSSVECASD